MRILGFAFTEDAHAHVCMCTHLDCGADTGAVHAGVDLLDETCIYYNRVCECVCVRACVWVWVSHCRGATEPNNSDCALNFAGARMNPKLTRRMESSATTEWESTTAGRIPHSRPAWMVYTRGSLPNRSRYAFCKMPRPRDVMSGSLCVCMCVRAWQRVRNGQCRILNSESSIALDSRTRNISRFSHPHTKVRRFPTWRSRTTNTPASTHTYHPGKGLTSPEILAPASLAMASYLRPSSFMCVSARFGRQRGEMWTYEHMCVRVRGAKFVCSCRVPGHWGHPSLRGAAKTKRGRRFVFNGS